MLRTFGKFFFLKYLPAGTFRRHPIMNCDGLTERLAMQKSDITKKLTEKNTKQECGVLPGLVKQLEEETPLPELNPVKRSKRRKPKRLSKLLPRSLRMVIEPRNPVIEGGHR